MRETDCRGWQTHSAPSSRSRVSFLNPTPHTYTDETFELTVKQADLEPPDSLHDRPFGSLQPGLGKRDVDNSAIILLPHRWTHTHTESQEV